LGDNKISDEGAKAMAEALKINNKYNEISNEVAEAIAGG
jgi:hypothetical protein